LQVSFGHLYFFNFFILLLILFTSFLFILGHAKIIDKFLSDPRASYNDTVVRDGIIFHDEDHNDPDWKVQQCYLLLIASATEIVSGVENFWKQGPSAG